MYAYYATVYATIQDIVEPALRGTAMALYFFAMYLAGASFGPLGTGMISDYFTAQAASAAGVTDHSIGALEPFRGAGLHAAMYVIPGLAALLALVLFGASRTVGKDIEALHAWTADGLETGPSPLIPLTRTDWKRSLENCVSGSPRGDGPRIASRDVLATPARKRQARREETRMNVPLTPIRFLRYAGEQFADDVAVVCGDQRFTYAQFADRAARLAGALRAEGARSGDRMAFLSTNCHVLLESYYGVLEAECVLLPLNVRLAPAELSYVLNNAGARFLFVEKACCRWRMRSDATSRESSASTSSMASRGPIGCRPITTSSWSRQRRPGIANSWSG